MPPVEDDDLDDDVGLLEMEDLDDDQDLDLSDDDTPDDQDDQGHDQGQDDQGQSQQRQSRGNRQFGALRRENRDLRERIARIEGANEARSTQAQPQITAADLERQEREYLANLDEGQQREYFRQKDRRDFAQAIGQQNFQLSDKLDKMDFDRLCDRAPAYKKVARRVEEVLAQQRKQGQNPTRQAVANFLIGQAVVDKQTSSGDRNANRARQRQRRNAAPANPGSNVPADRGERRGKANLTARERLEKGNITF